MNHGAYLWVALEAGRDVFPVHCEHTCNRDKECGQAHQEHFWIYEFLHRETDVGPYL